MLTKPELPHKGFGLASFSTQNLWVNSVSENGKKQAIGRTFL
jgi:hypothetical protein